MSRLGRLVVDTLADWDPSARVVDLAADTSGNRSTVDVAMASGQASQPAWRLAEILATTVGHPVDVTVEYRLVERDEATAG